jgi:TonB family protein
MEAVVKMFLRTVLFCTAAVLSAQSAETVADLVRQATSALGDRVAGRPEGARLLSQALTRCRPAAAIDAKDCAQAAVLSGLISLGENGPRDSVRPDLANAVHYYEGAGDDAGLALALETLASVQPGDALDATALRQRALAIRIRRVDEMSIRNSVAKGIVTPLKPGGGITPPKPREKREPAYSDEARIARHQGSVLMSIVIDVDGSVRDIRLKRSLGFGLDEAAYEAVRSWKFEPSMRYDEPVAVAANVEVNFRLL